MGPKLVDFEVSVDLDVAILTFRVSNLDPKLVHFGPLRETSFPRVQI